MVSASCQFVKVFVYRQKHIFPYNYISFNRYIGLQQINMMCFSLIAHFSIIILFFFALYGASSYSFDGCHLFAWFSFASNQFLVSNSQFYVNHYNAFRICFVSIRLLYIYLYIQHSNGVIHVYVYPFKLAISY